MFLLRLPCSMVLKSLTSRKADPHQHRNNSLKERRDMSAFQIALLRGPNMPLGDQTRFKAQLTRDLSLLRLQMLKALKFILSFSPLSLHLFTNKMRN